MHVFDFVTSHRICFGSGRFGELGDITKQFGHRVCLVTGGKSIESSGRLAAIEQQYKQLGLEWMRVRVDREPTVELIDAAVKEARKAKADVVVGIGGGSVLDAGKAIAALLTNPGQCIDYLEGVGKGAVLHKQAAPFIAVPTTAGTGSEVTKNSVIGNEAKTFKKSMRSDSMLPAVALVDPELTIDLPLPVTAACGMDAIAQLLEAFTSRRASPLTDVLALEGLSRARKLPKLLKKPKDIELREAMAMAALLGGICLANAGLGAVHGLASPLGAYYPIPHGIVCGALLPAVVWLNTNRALHDEQPEVLRKYRTACQCLFGGLHEIEPDLGEIDGDCPICHKDWKEEFKAAQFLSHHLAQMKKDIKLPGIGHFGIKSEDFPRIIAEGRGNSMKTNPVELTDNELAQILEASL